MRVTFEIGQIKPVVVLYLIISPSDVGFLKTNKWVQDGFMREQNKRPKYDIVLSLGNQQMCHSCFEMTRDQM